MLGAARIAEEALITPARTLEGVSVAAVAARDPARARNYAAEHSIPRVFDDYDALLDSDDIDAVYIPLPAALHGTWAKRALAAGKHVLLEKPFTANADEAAELADVVTPGGPVLLEAFHTLFHPAVNQLRDILESGAIGMPTDARATFCVPIPPGKDIRWDERLGGGSLMDVGCYPVRLLQDLFGYEATVISSRAWVHGGVDRAIEARLQMPSGVSASVVSSMWSRRVFSAHLRIRGTEGSVRMGWPYHPHRAKRITVKAGRDRRSHQVDRRSTYSYQLEAFRDAAQNRRPVYSGPEQSLAMMRLIDAIYRAAGLAPRMPLLP